MCYRYTCTHLGIPVHTCEEWVNVDYNTCTHKSLIQKSLALILRDGQSHHPKTKNKKCHTHLSLHSTVLAPHSTYTILHKDPVLSTRVPPSTLGFTIPQADERMPSHTSPSRQMRATAHSSPTIHPSPALCQTSF